MTSVYIETTIVSHLTARQSRDVVQAGIQQMTLDWWDFRRQQFELFSSELVWREAAAGDPQAAAKRLVILNDLPLLLIRDDALSLARTLLDRAALPSKATEDALHVALCAVHGIDYLLTWNCKHIANGIMMPRISQVCRDCGIEPPTICTPAELMEAPDVG